MVANGFRHAKIVGVPLFAEPNDKIQELQEALDTLITLKENISVQDYLQVDKRVKKHRIYQISDILIK